MARAPDPIVIVLSSARRTKRGVAGAVLSFVVALAAAAYAIFAGDPSGRIGASIVAVVLFLLGVLLLAGMGVGVGGRDLTFAEDGLGWSGGRRSGAWRLDWDELTSASLHVGYRSRPTNRNFRVRIELVAAPDGPAGVDPFVERHPQLRGRQLRRQPGVYSIALGPRRDLLDRLDNAFAIFAGDRYLGPVDDGPLGGAMAPAITGVREDGPRQQRFGF